MKNILFEDIIYNFFENPIIELPTSFGSGHINDTFKFSIQNGQNIDEFILQRINQIIFKSPIDIMENIQVVATHLSENNYQKKILNPILTKDGKTFFQTSQNDYWRIFPFFKNTYTVDKVENENLAFIAAKAFGEYLNHLKNLNPNQIKTTISNFHNGVLRFKKFESVLKTADENRINLAIPEIRFMIDHYSIFQKITQIKFPIRITHNDTKINNVLLDKSTQKAVAIIDLDTLMPGIVLSDFGDMVRTFTNSAEEDEPDLTKVEMRKNIFEALKVGFLSEMKDLTKLEKSHLNEGAKWIILMQVMRFLTDFLEGDIYYKTKYPNHNLVRTKNQIKLFKNFVQQIA